MIDEQEFESEDDDKWLESQEILFSRPLVFFKDVGGLLRVKEEVKLMIIEPFKHPELYKAYGRKAGGAVLFYGPPGCGKTLMAKAIAGECALNFTSIEIHNVLDSYIGQSEKRLHSLFENARRNAPSLMFIDEVDALIPSRAKASNNSGISRLVNQFLSEMDSLYSNNDNILIIGATNRPWDIDDAARRPGRFDRMIFIPPPDPIARREIMKIYLSKLPGGNDIKLESLAQKTRNYSGADLKAITERAVDMQIKESLSLAVTSKGKPAVLPLTTEVIVKSMQDSMPSTLEWIETAKNYCAFANQGGYWTSIQQWIDNSN